MKADILSGYAKRVTEANRSELTLLEYEIIIECMNYLKEEYKEENVVLARKFVNRLMKTLNYEYAVSFELMPFYIYVDKELVKAKTMKSGAHLGHALHLMETLKKGFDEVAKQDTSKPVMQNTETVYAGLTYGKGSLDETVISDANRGFKA